MGKRSCGCAARAKSKAEVNADLTKDAKAIVAEVEGYSKADRDKKAAEVKAAFPPEKKPTAKKEPTHAGMSKGSHDGDQC